jgi:hypothetical protein
MFQSSDERLAQIYTGFGMLEESGVINLRIERGKNKESGIVTKPVLRVIINENIKVIYDTYDGARIDGDDLSWCDFYFKRSFNKEKVKLDRLDKKVFPLGFNYSVYGQNDHGFRRIILAILNVRSIISSKDVARLLIRNSNFLSRILSTTTGKYTSYYKKYESIPRFDLEPKIFFFARLWDPSKTGQLNPEPIEDRYRINKKRIECVKKLKLEFPTIFMGGIERSDYALKNCKEYVVENYKMTGKNEYLKLLKQSSICIATAGLRGSNGWKLSEYIAGSKAIVTEKLHFQVPGDFEKEKNYLEFSTPDECVDKVTILLKDNVRRYEIMRNNYLYYQQYLRPDMLVGNTLKIISGSIFVS